MERIVMALIAAACILGIAVGSLYIYKNVSCINLPYIYTGCGIVK